MTKVRKAQTVQGALLADDTKQASEKPNGTSGLPVDGFILENAVPIPERASLSFTIYPFDTMLVTQSFIADKVFSVPVRQKFLQKIRSYMVNWRKNNPAATMEPHFITAKDVNGGLRCWRVKNVPFEKVIEASLAGSVTAPVTKLIIEEPQS